MTLSSTKIRFYQTKLIREGSPGAAGSWDLTMRKGSAQKMLNEYCTVLNEYLDRECERI